MRLPDGRTLDHREYGDPHGYPVVNNHGGLMCGMDIEPADATAKELGLRIISPDRPGVGDSTQLSGRTTGDWPADVGALLQSLGIDECGAFGWSLGSDYALALGAAGVANQVVVVGGMPPSTPERLARLNRTDRVLSRLSQQHPATARAAFVTMRTVAGLTHDATARMSGVDADAVRGLTQFPDWMRHALQQPQGMVEEYRAMCRPWGFDVAHVGCPVDVWHGTQDEYVPLDLGRELAQQLPHATMHEVADAGHFLAYSRWADVLAPFATPARPAG